MGHGNQRPEIELVRAFMPVLVTSNFDDDSIKNEWASMEPFSHYKSMGIFYTSRAANSIVSGPIWPKFELVRDFMNVLVTCKYKKYIWSKRTENNWRHHFPHYKSIGAFSFLREIFSSFLREIFSFVREILFSFLREIFSFVREKISFLREILSFVREKISILQEIFSFFFLFLFFFRKNLVPSRNSLVCSRKNLVPSRNILVPLREKNLVSSRNILVPSRIFFFLFSFFLIWPL